MTAETLQRGQCISRGRERLFPGLWKERRWDAKLLQRRTAWTVPLVKVLSEDLLGLAGKGRCSPRMQRDIWIGVLARLALWFLTRELGICPVGGARVFVGDQRGFSEQSVLLANIS